VYDKTSHFRKGNYAPVKSVGVVRNKDNKLVSVVIHMTPELRKHPSERKALLRHESREAKLIAQGKSVHYAHRQAANKDPQYIKGEKGYANIWERLGHESPKFK
jgi:hypothetical protein